MSLTSINSGRISIFENMFLHQFKTTLQNHLQDKALRWQEAWKCCQCVLTFQVGTWDFQNTLTMGQAHKHQLSGRKSPGTIIFVVCLRVKISRNPLASTQLSSSNFTHQHSFAIRPSARQMSWQEIRQVQWKSVFSNYTFLRIELPPHGIFAWTEMLQWNKYSSSGQHCRWILTIWSWDRHVFCHHWAVSCSNTQLEARARGNFQEKKIVLTTHHLLWTKKNKEGER